MIEAVRPRLESVKRAGGAVPLSVGVWLVVLAIWADRFAGLFPV